MSLRRGDDLEHFCGEAGRPWRALNIATLESTEHCARTILFSVPLTFLFLDSSLSGGTLINVGDMASSNSLTGKIVISAASCFESRLANGTAYLDPYMMNPVVSCQFVPVGRGKG